MSNITIGISAFEGNKDLKSFSWEKIVRIEVAAFKNCALEGELSVPKGNIWIYNEAFSGNKLTKVVFPDDIQVVGPYVFADNQIEDLHLGALKSIKGSRWKDELNIEVPGILSYGLFKNNLIKRVVFPKNSGDTALRMIGTDAFANNKIEEIIIPYYLGNIYFRAFENNEKLKKVIFATEDIPGKGKVNHAQVDRYAFLGNEGWHKDTKKVAIYRKNDKGEYVVINDAKDGEQHVFNLEIT